MQNRAKSSCAPYLACPTIRTFPRKGTKMAKRTFWVQIETDTDNPGIPDKADIYRVLLERGSYGIIDIVDEEDITEIVFK